MWILGLSCFRDDATVALLKDGAVVGISEEERFLRVKHAVELPPGRFISSLGETAPLEGLELRYFPEQSISYVLREAGIEERDIDVIAYDFDYDRRIRHWDRFLPVSELQSRRQNEEFIATLRYWQHVLKQFANRCGARLEYVPHHLAHAAGTVFGSGFPETAFLVMDALGELESTTLGYFDGNFRVSKHINLPHSLGIVYAAVTSFLGFRPFSDEQKTMGLASYGDPRVFETAFRQILRPTKDGFVTDRDAVWGSDVIEVDRPPALAQWLNVPSGPAPAEVCQPPYTHVAAALQQALEAVVNHLVDQLMAGTRSRRLCLAGGVALNCMANGTLLRRGDIDELYIQPQAGDSGTALGAAYYTYFSMSASHPEPLPHAYWGPGFTSSEVRTLLDRLKLPYQQTDEPWAVAAEMLADNKVVGWFQGRSECGPRALGNRSILTHPGDATARDRINMIVKDRELWRPFAASVLDERRSRYLAIDVSSPFMLLTIPLTELGRKDLVAAAHVDGTTRPQTVSAATNPRFHRLIDAFERRTGIGAVLNTSLNVKGEPIVNEPLHAIADFYTTGMDALVIEDFVLAK